MIPFILLTITTYPQWYKCHIPCLPPQMVLYSIPCLGCMVPTYTFMLTTSTGLYNIYLLSNPLSCFLDFNILPPYLNLPLLRKMITWYLLDFLISTEYISYLIWYNVKLPMFIMVWIHWNRWPLVWENERLSSMMQFLYIKEDGIL